MKLNDKRGLTIELEIEDITYTVEFSFFPGCPATYYQPKEWDRIEIDEVRLDGVQVDLPFEVLYQLEQMIYERIEEGFY